MNLEDIMLGEINQTERRQIPYGFMNVRNLKNKVSLMCII